MGLTAILLKTGTVPTAAPPLSPVYQPATQAPKKAATVKSMRFTNTGSGTAKLRIWFRKGGGTMNTEADGRRILPYDQVIPAGYTLIEDAELTLDTGDGVYFKSDSSGVDFALCGVEQDVS